MSDLVVRDPSRPCEHGLAAPHLLGPQGGHGICPGGREITLRAVGLTFPYGLSGAMYRDTEDPPDQTVYVMVEEA